MGNMPDAPRLFHSPESVDVIHPGDPRCMRTRGRTRAVSTKSHAIPRLPAPTYFRKRCNLKDLLPQLEGLTGELHAILLSSRLETAARTARSLRTGNAKTAAPVRTIVPRTPDVTNVVNSEHFQSFNTGSCYKRRQTKPKTSVFWRNIVWIDDVCNNRPWRPTKSRSN